MAKGRKLTASHSERFLGTNAHSHSYAFNPSDSPELRESDVWYSGDDAGAGDHRTAAAPYRDWDPRAAAEANRRRRFPAGHHVGGLSLAFEDKAADDNATTSSMIVHQYRGHDGVAAPARGHHMAASAPVNVPDWSKILRVDSAESMHEEVEDDQGYEEDGMVPPHEYLAREYARSRKSAANSVFEGVGRTLKGRDMSRVRDAVWSQTGFDG